MWGGAPKCVKESIHARKHTHIRTRMHARTHNADLGPRRHWTKPHTCRTDKREALGDSALAPRVTTPS